MKHQVLEWHSAQRDAQAVHVGEVRLRRLTGFVHLREHPLAARPELRSPASDLALQCPHLAVQILPRLPLLEQPEQRRRLQRRVSFELPRDPWPLVVEWARPRAIRPRLLELVRQFAMPLVAADRAHAHSRTRGSLFLGSTLGALAPHQQYLRVALHAAPFQKRHAAPPATTSY